MAVVALVEHQSAERRLAEMHRLFNHRLEHWLQVPQGWAGEGRVFNGLPMFIRKKLPDTATRG